MASSLSPPDFAFSPPRNGFFRWLTDPGRRVPTDMRRNLLGELLTAPSAVLIGVFSAMLVSGYAIVVLHELVFLVFVLLNLVGAIFICRAAFAMSRGDPVSTDLYLWAAIWWCAQQGCMAFVAMRTGVPALQLLAATFAMGLMGPACSRQYAAPRWALFLIALIEVPLVVGAALSGTVWGTILVVQAPAYLLASFLLIRRFQALAVANLIAQNESLYNANHDTLTAVLNRAGFRQAMAALGRATMPQHVMFYLDLNEFKAVNESLGHGVGDRLLTQVAGRMKAFLGSSDLIGRLGSDEFVIVAHEMPSTEAASFGHALIRCISDAPYDLGGSIPVFIGVSIGFACCPEDGTNPDILQSMADAALHDAKATGIRTACRFRSRGVVGSSG